MLIAGNGLQSEFCVLVSNCLHTNVPIARTRLCAYRRKPAAGNERDTKLGTKSTQGVRI